MDRSAGNRILVMSHILVTGGSGFVGRELVRWLISSGHSVRVVSRQLSIPVADVELHHTEDLFAADEKELESHLTGVDCVVHLGWYVNPNDYIVSDKNWDCLSGSIRLGLVARRMEIGHFVGIGTCIEYERTNEFRELTTPLRPDTTYGAAKASLYLSLAQIFKESGTEFAWCRLFFLHGQDQNSSRLVPRMKSDIERGVVSDIGDPSESRDYLEVTEAARRIGRVVDKKLSGAFNVCSGTAVSALELFEQFATQMDRLDLVEAVRSTLGPDTASKSQRIVGVPSPELID